MIKDDTFINQEDNYVEGVVAQDGKEDPKCPDLSLGGIMLESDQLEENKKRSKITAKEIKEKLVSGEKENSNRSPKILKAKDLSEVRKEVDEIDRSMVRAGDKYKEVKIDKKIRELIIGLKRWRVETLESCGGHRLPFGFRHRYPLVRFSKDNEGLVGTILEAYGNGAEWVIEASNTGESLVLHPKLLEGENGLIFIPRLKA